MSIRAVSSSRLIGSEVCLQAMSEPVTEQSESGVYLGKTGIYKLPFYLDAGKLINPHIVVLGMSGSGKTYLLRSLIVRSSIYNACRVLVLDWNGEYRDVIEFLNGETIKVRPGAAPDHKHVGARGLFGNVTRIDFSELRDEDQRGQLSRNILRDIIEFMHGAKFSKDQKAMIVLDEGWRLLGNSGEVAALFREGRKYGFGFVVATQLAKDINNEALANAACMVLFRLQNSEDYDILLGSGVIDDEDKRMLSKLDVGSCIVRLAERESAGRAKKFLMGRIDGVDVGVYNLTGGSVNVRISGKTFVKETEGLEGNDEARSKIVEFVNDNDRGIDLVALVKLLVKLQIRRAEIIRYLRAFGIGDLDIVRACTRAGGAVVELVE